jgi:outer membrane protein assembly factor BamB
MTPSTYPRRALRAVVSLGAVLCAWLVQGSGTAADWPQWRGPNRDGISKEHEWLSEWPAAGPTLLWKAKVGRGHGSVAVVGDRLYALGFSWKMDAGGKLVKDENGKEIGLHRISCLDASTGKEMWQYAHSFAKAPYGDQAYCTPTVHEGLVYCLGVLGDLLCLDAASGKLVWARNLTRNFPGKRPYYGYAGSPLVVDDRVIVEGGGAKGLILALERKTGRTIWQYEHGRGDMAGYCSPVTYRSSGKLGIVCLTQTALLGVAAEDGKELWRYPCSIGACMTPIVSGDKVFISGTGGGRKALLLNVTENKPNVVWQNKEMTQCFQSCVLVGGYLYGTHNLNHEPKRASLRCVSLESGEVKWEQSDLGHASLIAAAGKLIIMSQYGEVLVAEASPKGYKELARAKVVNDKCYECQSYACPVLANGRLYCRNGGGDLVCLDVKKP